MKKFSLLLCLCLTALMVPLWAEATTISDSNPMITVESGVLTITSPAATSLRDYMQTLNSEANYSGEESGEIAKREAALTKLSQMKACSKIVLDGKFNSDDLSKIANDQGFNNVTEVNMAEARIVTNNSYSNNTNLKFHSDEEANNFSPKPAIGTIAVIGGDLYQWTSIGRIWNNLNYVPGNAVYYATQSDRDAVTNSLELNSTAKIPASLVYRQMSATGEKTWTYLSTSQPSGTVVDHTALNDTWLESELESKKESTTDGTQIKILRFYQLQETNGVREWVHVTPATRPLDRENGEGGTDIVYVAESVGADIDHLDPKQGVLGSYIRFNVYYRLNQASYEWGESTETVSGSYVDGGFHDNERDSHKNYPNGQWVRMGYGDYSYSQLVNAGNSWGNSINYEAGTEIGNNYMEAADISRLQDGSVVGQYGVVGSSSKKIWNGNSWASLGTEIPHYADMKFSYWSETLTTATTSRYADESISNEVFNGCKKLATVNYLSGNVTGFGNHGVAQGYNNSSTDNHEFDGTGLSVTIGKDVSKIDDDAFLRCDVLTSLNFNNSYSLDEKTAAATYYSNGGERPVYPKDLTIGNESFMNCSRLSAVEFPNRVISIGYSAFKEAGNSASDGKFDVSFERRLVSKGASIDYNHDLIIGEGAFFQCINLEEIELPIRLAEMGNDAFKLTSSLTTVSIREDIEDAKLKVIPSGAFEESAVTNVVIPRSVTEIKPKAFGSCYALQTVRFQEQIVSEGVAQEPLIIRTGAFATGNESQYHLTDVYVNIDPNVRLLVCEFDAFAFITLVGQTDVTHSKATLHFINNGDAATNERNWNYYAGQWKKGMAFTQSNLNSMKDGLTGYRGSQQPTVATNGIVSGIEPANGWQQFAVSNTDVDVIIRGNYLRTYSTPQHHYIPKKADTGDYLYDIYRVTSFSDGWSSGQNINDRSLADAATRTATATKVELTLAGDTRLYVPEHTGLLLKTHGNDENYFIYQDFIGSSVTTTTYPHNITVGSETANLLYPSCDDTNTREVTEGNTKVTKVIINPTIPYPIGDISSSPSDKFRVFGLYTEDNCFWRSEPNVEINQDMAYLKLPTSLFHWANESMGIGNGVPNSARISLVFEEDDNEVTGIESVVTSAGCSTDGYYSIQGIKFSRPQGRGLYIHNGKKLFVK